MTEHVDLFRMKLEMVIFTYIDNAIVIAGTIVGVIFSAIVYIVVGTIDGFIFGVCVNDIVWFNVYVNNCVILKIYEIQIAFLLLLFILINFNN